MHSWGRTVHLDCSFFSGFWIFPLWSKCISTWVSILKKNFNTWSQSFSPFPRNGEQIPCMSPKVLCLLSVGVIFSTLSVSLFHPFGLFLPPGWETIRCKWLSLNSSTLLSVIGALKLPPSTPKTCRCCKNKRHKWGEKTWRRNFLCNLLGRVFIPSVFLLLNLSRTLCGNLLDNKSCYSFITLWKPYFLFKRGHSLFTCPFSLYL